MRIGVYSTIFTIATAAILVVGFPFFYVSDASFSVDIIVVNLVLFLFVAYRIVISEYRANIDCVTLSFYAFVYVFMVVAAWAQMTASVFPLPGWYSESRYFDASVIVLLGVVSYEVGLRHSRALGPRLLGSLVPDRKWPWWFIAGLVVLPPVLLVMFGLVDSLFSSRVDRTYAVASAISDSSSLSLLVDAAIRIPFLVLSIYFFFRRRGPSFTFWMASIASLIINNPISSPRYIFGFAVVLFLGMIFFRARDKFRSHYAMGLVLALLFIFPVLDAWRYDVGASIKIDISDSIKYNSVASNGDYDAYQQLLNGIGYADKEGFSYGRQLLGAVLFWVPRSLWPDKPVSSGGLVASTLRYYNENLSMPLWGEFYLDFGYLGVVAGFFLFGGVVKSIRTLVGRDPAYWVLDRKSVV